MSEYLIYTDGACSGNPGPGGWGAIVIADHARVTELGAAQAATTNNRMEMTAVIEALRSLQVPQGNIIVCTDSTYVIRGITQWVFGWKRRGWVNAEGREILNKDLWLELDRIVAKLKGRIQWKYVPGHAGVAGNERCDQIAVAFSQGLRPYLYEGSLNDYSYPVDSIPPDFPLPEMKSHSKPQKSKDTFYLSLVDGVLLKHKTWPDCQGRVKGRSGAKFKKATTPEEAKAILASWGLKPNRWDEL